MGTSPSGPLLTGRTPGVRPRTVKTQPISGQCQSWALETSWHTHPITEGAPGVSPMPKEVSSRGLDVVANRPFQTLAEQLLRARQGLC